MPDRFQRGNAMTKFKTFLLATAFASTGLAVAAPASAQQADTTATAMNSLADTAKGHIGSMQTSIVALAVVLIGIALVIAFLAWVLAKSRGAKS